MNGETEMTTTETETYQGWTTRETWSFVLLVTNDYNLYTGARDWMTTENDDEKPDLLKDWAETMFTRLGYVNEYNEPLWPDSLADAACEIGSLGRVNWIEAAAAIMPSE